MGAMGAGRTALASRIRAVLFDKDGTLVDYDRSWGPLNRRAARLAAGADPALAERLMIVGGLDPATGRTAAGSLLAAASTIEIAAAWVAAGSALAAAELTAALDALFTASVAEMVPVCDLPPLMARLKARGLMLGVASSDSAASVRAAAGHLGFLDLLDFTAGYDSGFGRKPGGGMVAGFAAATGLPAAAIAVVGDNLHDIEMARAAGAGLAVGVLTGTGTAEALAAAADLCLPDVAALEAVLFPC